jgi:hypothetical protein
VRGVIGERFTAAPKRRRDVIAAPAPRIGVMSATRGLTKARHMLAKLFRAAGLMAALLPLMPFTARADEAAG